MILYVCKIRQRVNPTPMSELKQYFFQLFSPLCLQSLSFSCHLGARSDTHLWFRSGLHSSSSKFMVALGLPPQPFSLRPPPPNPSISPNSMMKKKTPPTFPFPPSLSLSLFSSSSLTPSSLSPPPHLKKSSDRNLQIILPTFVMKVCCPDRSEGFPRV